MAIGKNKKQIYESRGVNMGSTNRAGFKATALRFSGTTPSSRGLNNLRYLPLVQVSKTQPISRNGDGITPLHYGYPSALTRKNALNTSTFETSPPSPPLLEEESMEASVAGFENRMTEDNLNVEHFSAWSPFDEPFITIDKEQQPENVPPQVPVSSSYEILDCPNAMNDSAPFPRTLLSDSLNWPNFSHCLRSGNKPAPNPTHLPRGSFNLLIWLNYQNALRFLEYSTDRRNIPGPVPATLPSWNPYWPSYPNGQGSENMVPPVPGYLPSGSLFSRFNSQNIPSIVPAGLPYGGVYGSYYHGFGTIPSWSLSYPSVQPSQNIPPVPAP